MDNELLVRLKHRDHFQGARHELFAEAACLRAGFGIEHENEKDYRTRHAEFTATHKKTGQRISVEAKSRHRPGVLGRPGMPEPEEEVSMRFGSLINDAIKKAVPYPLVIFLDTNLPPARAEAFYRPESTIPFKPPHVSGRLCDLILGNIRKEHNGCDPYVQIVFTNHPHHYGREDEIAPSTWVLSMVSTTPCSQVTPAESLVAIDGTARLYGKSQTNFNRNRGSRERTMEPTPLRFSGFGQ